MKRKVFGVIIVAVMSLLAACGKIEIKMTPSPEEELRSIYESAKQSFLTAEDKEILTEEKIAAILKIEEDITKAYENGDRPETEKLIEKWNAETKDFRELKTAYRNTSLTPFSGKDLSLLSDDDLEKYYSLQEQLDKAYYGGNNTRFSAVKSEWSSFCSTARNKINAAKDKMISDWLSSANLGSSLTGLFSLGTLKSTNSVKGHTIVLSNQYTVDTNTDQVRKESSLRRWLNRIFYYDAFSEEEAQYIIPVATTNTYRFVTGGDDIDKVFCLSLSDVKKLMPTVEERVAKNTAFAKSQMKKKMLASSFYPDTEAEVEAKVADWENNFGVNCSWWWLKDPAGSYINAKGEYVAPVDRRDLNSVRACIWVELR